MVNFCNQERERSAMLYLSSCSHPQATRTLTSRMTELSPQGCENLFLGAIQTLMTRQRHAFVTGQVLQPTTHVDQHFLTRAINVHLHEVFNAR